MGTGASVVLSAEKELEIYRKLQAEYEESRKAHGEDEAVLYERLRKKFHELTAKPEPTAPSVEVDTRARGQQHGVRKSHSNTESEDGAEDRSSDMHLGDVVRCRQPGEALFFEGVIVANYNNGTFLVDFGQEESTEQVNINDMQKIMSWNELELKDHVQVKDEDMPIYSHAVIIGIHTNGTYDVQYDGSDEKEYNVKAARIRKLRSNRSKAAEKWALLRNTVRASGLFHRTPHHEHEHDGGPENEETYRSQQQLRQTK